MTRRGKSMQKSKLRVGVVTALIVLVGVSAALAFATSSAASKPSTSYAFPVTGTAQTTGETVAGTFTIQRFKVINGVLTAVGTFSGTVDGVSKTSTATVAVTSIDGHTLSGATAAAGIAAAANGSCQILDLTLGPLHLDLLGLVVDLNQVHLQITAQQGSGNLLGNLLCAVAGLLDNGANTTNLLQSIANLLNQILAQL
jgi:hypothetical protein